MSVLFGGLYKAAILNFFFFSRVIFALSSSNEGLTMTSPIYRLDFDANKTPPCGSFGLSLRCMSYPSW